MKNQTRNRSELGRTNRRAVLAEVVLNGPLPRTEIALATGLTTAAVSRITRDLIDAGLLIELPDETGDEDSPRGPGRRFVQLDVNPAGGYVLGIGVNVFNQTVTIADLKNNNRQELDLKLSEVSEPDAVIRAIADAARQLTARAVADRRRLLGASIAFTGAVEPATGVVRTSPYLRWGEVRLGDKLADAMGMPVYIESLSVAMALAESRFGIAQGITNMLTVNCSLGTGASILMDGRIVRGNDFSAGLIGGITLEDDTPLDILAGGHGVLMRLHGHDLDIPGTPANRLAEMLMQAISDANNGDATARRAISDAGRALGRALRPFAQLLRPEALMITGPLTKAGVFVDAWREAFAAPEGAYAPKLLVSGLSPQAAARWVAIDEFLLERDLNLDDLKLSKAA